MPESGCKSSHSFQCPQEASNLLSLTIETLIDRTTADLHSLGSHLTPRHLVLLPSRWPSVRTLYTPGCFLNYQVRTTGPLHRPFTQHTGTLEKLAGLNRPLQPRPRRLSPLTPPLRHPHSQHADSSMSLPSSSFSLSPASATMTAHTVPPHLLPASLTPVMPLPVHSPNSSWRNLLKTQI